VSRKSKVAAAVAQSLPVVTDAQAEADPSRHLGAAIAQAQAEAQAEADARKAARDAQAAEAQATTERNGMVTELVDVTSQSLFKRQKAIVGASNAKVNEDAAILAKLKDISTRCGADRGKFAGVVDQAYGNGVNAKLGKKGGYIEGEVSAKVRSLVPVGRTTAEKAAAKKMRRVIDKRLSQIRKVAAAMTDLAYVMTDEKGVKLGLQALYNALVKPASDDNADGETVDTTPEAMQAHIGALWEAGALAAYVKELALQLCELLDDEDAAIGADMVDIADALIEATAE
jgi:hypothetical protein